MSLIVMQAFFGLAFLSLASQRLSTDGERVVKRGLFVGGSCRCDQLDHIEIGEPYSRMGRSYRFIRKDATLAFTGNTAVWKKSRVKKMAAALGVPFTEASGGAPGTLES